MNGNSLLVSPVVLVPANDGHTVISSLAGAASALLAAYGGCIWRLARSPDSDWKVGLVIGLPVFALAAALGPVAYWTRRRRPDPSR